MEDSNFIISIQDLLKGRNRNVDFDNADPKRIRLMRHSYSTLIQKDSVIYKVFKGTVYELYHTNFDNFLIYQSEQHEKTLENIDYIVSFIGEGNDEARFIGIYRNNGKKVKTEFGNYLYDLKEIDGFEKLRERVIVKWGYTRGLLYKWETKVKEVIHIEKEIFREKVPMFYRYEDIKLSYSELKKVVKNKEWQYKLDACNCVYLILDTNNGKKYVGVTYKDKNYKGKNGILSRWTDYANTGHGGDEKLEQLLLNNGNIYAENFQWCILETLPLNVLPNYAIERESLWKEKLGTRKFGYNLN